MKKLLIYFICILLLSSCNRLSDTFFEFLFNYEGINLSRDCSDNPSIFEEGRSFEIYSMPNINNEIIKSILDKSKYSKSIEYPRYSIPIWHKTPINLKDSVYQFIQSELGDRINKCFKKKDLIEILVKEGNYYTILIDNLGTKKLFVWDTAKQKLFLLTTYEL